MTLQTKEIAMELFIVKTVRHFWHKYIRTDMILTRYLSSPLWREMMTPLFSPVVKVSVLQEVLDDFYHYGLNNPRILSYSMCDCTGRN